MKHQTKIQSITNVWLLTLLASIIALIFWKSNWRFALLTLALLSFFLLVLASVHITQKHIAKISPLLLDACDPEKFLGAVVASLPPRRPKRADYTWTMHLYEGQYAAGRYGDALAGLQYTIRFNKGRTGAYEKAAYHLNLAEVSIALGRLQDAERELDECLRLLESVKTPGKFDEILRRGYQNELNKLSIAQGLYDGAEFFISYFDQAKNEYGRVGAKYHLALIYQHNGETEKAREAFEYVAEHGNRLHLAALARQQLGLPPQPGVARFWQKEDVSY